MNKQYLPSFAAILLAYFLIAPGIAAADEITCKCVAPSEAKQLIEECDVFILDVRTPLEYDYGHIEGATLIPVQNTVNPPVSTLSEDQLLAARMKELPHNKHTKILVYCKTGTRSANASKMLVEAGYKNIYDMKGGIKEWIKAGYPIVATYDSWTKFWV